MTRRRIAQRRRPGRRRRGRLSAAAELVPVAVARPADPGDHLRRLRHHDFPSLHARHRRDLSPWQPGDRRDRLDRALRHGAVVPGDLVLRPRRAEAGYFRDGAGLRAVHPVHGALARALQLHAVPELLAGVPRERVRDGDHHHQRGISRRAARPGDRGLSHGGVRRSRRRGFAVWLRGRVGVGMARDVSAGDRAAFAGRVFKAVRARDRALPRASRLADRASGLARERPHAYQAVPRPLPRTPDAGRAAGQQRRLRRRPDDYLLQPLRQARPSLDLGAGGLGGDRGLPDGDGGNDHVRLPARPGRTPA